MIIIFTDTWFFTYILLLLFPIHLLFAIYIKSKREKVLVDEVKRMRKSKLTEEKKVQDILNIVNQSDNWETFIEVLNRILVNILYTYLSIQLTTVLSSLHTHEMCIKDNK